MKSSGLIVTGIILLLCSALVRADCRRVFVSPPVHKVAVVEKIITPVTVLTPVIERVLTVGIPTFNAVYNPVAPCPNVAVPNANMTGQDGQKELMEAVKLMTNQFQRIDERLQRLERGQGIQPLPSVQPMPKAEQSLQTPNSGVAGDFISLNKTYGCMACHDKSKSEGSFTMFDQGKIAELSPEQAGKIIERVLKGSMPKKPHVPLTEAQKIDYVSKFVTGK